MSETDKVIPSEWLSHVFCPRGLTTQLRLRQSDGDVILQLTPAYRILTFICAVLAIGLVTTWWQTQWGIETNDVQMKWITVGGGCVFGWLAIGSLLTKFRFLKYGQSFTYDTHRELVILKSRNIDERIPFKSLKGLQILTKAGTAQLNLLYESDDSIDRLWIHSDLERHIDLLVMEIDRLCKIHVVSRHTIDLGKS